MLDHPAPLGHMPAQVDIIGQGAKAAQCQERRAKDQRDVKDLRVQALRKGRRARIEHRRIQSHRATALKKKLDRTIVQQNAEIGVKIA